MTPESPCIRGLRDDRAPPGGGHVEKLPDERFYCDLLVKGLGLVPQLTRCAYGFTVDTECGLVIHERRRLKDMAIDLLAQMQSDKLELNTSPE